MSPKLYIIFPTVNVFSPGDTVSGYVEVTISEPFSCKALSIKISGNAQVSFRDSDLKRQSMSNKEEPTEMVEYFSSEDYYSMSFKLWGDGISRYKMAVGTRQFPFTFVLPLNIPSSFESGFGYVRHTCQAWMDGTSGVNSNILCSVPICVVTAYDLNNDQLTQKPISEKKEKILYNFVFKSGPVSFDVNIDRSGYVPGECILINAVCSNKSNKTMTKSRAEVVQIVHHKAGGKSKIEKKVVCYKEHSELPAGGDNIWENEPLLIPALPPSNLTGCNIMDIKYAFVFKFVPSGLSITLESQSDLVIGSVPLHMFSQSTPMHQSNYVAPRMSEPSLPPYLPYNNDAPAYPGPMEAPSAPPAGFAASNVYPDFPPSYEESMVGRKAVALEDFQYDFSDDEDDASYPSSKPRYPNLGTI